MQKAYEHKNYSIVVLKLCASEQCKCKPIVVYGTELRTVI